MSRTAIPRDSIDRRNRIATLRVSGRTPVGKLAGAIWKYVQEGFKVSLLGIGAGAVNQAVKAHATARDFAQAAKKDLYLAPVFDTEVVDEVTRTVLRLDVVLVELKES